MKRTLRKSLRRQKRSLENLSEMLAGIDYDKIRLQHKQYLQNLLATNQLLLKEFSVDSIILF